MVFSKYRLNRSWYAVALLVASGVGVGFYGIPFTFQKAGFLVGSIFFVALGVLSLIGNLLYGEVVLRTHRRHQFIGYVNKYLGVWPRRLNLFTFWVAIYGSLVGIIIISGDFLSNIFSSFLSFSPLVFSTLFIIFASVLVLAGLRAVSRFDFAIMVLFVLIVVLISLAGLDSINPGNYSLASRDFWFLPFGVILFTFNSSTGVPLMRERLAGQESKLRKTIFWGSLIPIIFYFLFTVVVVGVSGEITSPDAISGLGGFLGSRVVLLGSMFGFVSSFSIFLNLATSLKESLIEDFHFKNKTNWLLVMLPPYILFLLGLRNFIDIIGLVGGLVISIQLISLIFVYTKARESGERIPEYSISFPKWLLYFMILIFSLGAIYTLFIR